MTAVLKTCPLPKPNVSEFLISAGIGALDAPHRSFDPGRLDRRLHAPPLSRLIFSWAPRQKEKLGKRRIGRAEGEQLVLFFPGFTNRLPCPSKRKIVPPKSRSALEEPHRRELARHTAHARSRWRLPNLNSGPAGKVRPKPRMSKPRMLRKRPPSRLARWTRRETL